MIGSPDYASTAGAVPKTLRGTVTFAAGTTGAIGQHDIFTITGAVKFLFYARNVTALTSGGAATISIGRAADVAVLMAVTTATTFDPGDFVAPGNATVFESGAFMIYEGTPLVATTTVITADILAATITGGSNEYIIWYWPLSAGATVTLGAELVAS